MRTSIVGALSGRPLLITEEGLRLVFAVTSRDEFFADERIKALQSRSGEPLDNSRDATVRSGVAIIPVIGPLFRFSSLFTQISGATSYDVIRRDLQVAIDDPSVTAILLDVNSPGGDADGCGELAASIRAACDVKPVWAYVGGMGASAAYWIASATQRIVCAPSAFVGSIGVKTAIVDSSKAEEKDGFRTIEIVSSNAPMKRGDPVNDELIAKVQHHVDSLESHFIDAVAKYRGVSTNVVREKFGNGDIVIASDLDEENNGAVARGMADAIGNFESTLADLSGEQVTGVAIVAPLARKGSAMMKIKAEDSKPTGSDEDKNQDEEKKESKKAEGDEDPMVEEDKKDEDGEKAAAKALAAKLGLSADASLKQILTAAQATSVPLSRVSALVEKQVAERFAVEKQAREKAEATEKAEKLAALAVQGGYDPADKKALVEFATTNYAAAERSVSHFLRSASQLYGRTMAAGIDRPAAQSDVQVRQMGGVRIMKHGMSLSAEAKAMAKQEKISYEAALDRLVKEKPELYQAYLSQLS